jgi:hypothetical protein
MKKNPLLLGAFAVKAFIIIVIAICGFPGIHCIGQSITGKWKMTAAKETITDKASGKTQDLTAQTGNIVKMIAQIIEFHADNTYFTSSTLVGDKAGFEGNGTFSISGTQLKLKLIKTNPPALADKKYSNSMSKFPDIMTIESLTTNTLTLHYSAESNDRGKIYVADIYDIFQRQ